MKKYNLPKASKGDALTIAVCVNGAIVSCDNIDYPADIDSIINSIEPTYDYIRINNINTHEEARYNAQGNLIYLKEKGKRINEPIWVRMKRIRERKGLTVRELANLSNLNASNLSRIENGCLDAQLSTIERIANALGKRIDIF